MVMNKRLLRITDLKYRDRDDDVLVIATGRDSNGKRVAVHITGTRPYAFVPDHDNIDLEVGGHVDFQSELPDEAWIEDVESGYKGHDDVPLRKVTTTLPGNINDLKDEFDTVYEADIPYVRRVSIDYGLSGYVRVPESKVSEVGQQEVRAKNAPKVPVSAVDTDIDSGDVDEQIEPRVLMADIEAIPPGEGGSFDQFVEDADKAITAITTYDTYAEEYCAFVLDPEDVVEGHRVKEHLRDHWNDSDSLDTTDEYDKYVNDANIRLIKSTTEKDLLLSFIDEVESYRPDLISGWNWIDFDHQYILNRLRNHFDNINEHRLSDIGTVNGFKVAEKIDGLPGFDMMDAFCEKMTFSQWRSKSLDFVAGEELDTGKVADVSVGEAYQTDRNRFLAYNIIDTQLLVGLDEKHGIHEFFYELADLSHIQIYDTFSEMRLVDGFLMAHRNDDEILPTQSEKDLDKIPGGLVLTPSDGVEEWVAVFDLKSLYPSVFITLNVSEETLTKNPEDSELVCPAMPESEDSVGGTITDENIGWDVQQGAVGSQTDTEGVLPKYLALLFEERAEKKEIRNQYDPDDPRYNVWDNKQNAVKVIMNSFYGVSQNKYYRLSTPVQGSQGIGSTITAGGRYTLWRGAQIAENMGYDVKYGDTDSIMISLADSSEDVTAREVVQRGEEVEAAINDAMDDVADEFGIPEKHPFLKDKDLHGTDRHCLHWEFEKLYRRFLQAGTKKRYAGLKAWAEGKWLIDPDASDPDFPDPDITGFEANRADVPPITANTQKATIKKILAGADFEEVSEYVQRVVQSVTNHERELSSLGTPGVINKPLEEYPNRPTKRACLYSNEHLGYGFREGDDPWIYKVDETPPMKPSTDVLALEWGDEDLPEGYGLDVNGIIDKKIRQPLEPVIPWSFEELKSGRRMNSIDLGGSNSGDNPFAGESFESDTDTEEDEDSELTEASEETEEEEEDDEPQADDPLAW